MRYMILCANEGKYEVAAGGRSFATLPEAERHWNGISPSRRPLIVAVVHPAASVEVCESLNKEDTPWKPK